MFHQLFFSSHPCQGHFNRCSCFNIAFFYCFLVIQHFPLVHEVQLVSWDQCLSFHYFHYSCCILSHFMLIVFPLIVLTYTDMLRFSSRSKILRFSSVTSVKMHSSNSYPTFSLLDWWVVRASHWFFLSLHILSPKLSTTEHSQKEWLDANRPGGCPNVF